MEPKTALIGTGLSHNPKYVAEQIINIVRVMIRPYVATKSTEGFPKYQE